MNTEKFIDEKIKSGFLSERYNEDGTTSVIGEHSYWCEIIDELFNQRQETRPHETIVILREALQKELEAFKESEKSVETSQGHAHYEGIYIGLRIAINHIIQIEHPTK